MKKIIYPILFYIFCSGTSYAQNVGVGTNSPGTRFTVLSTGYGIEHTDGTVSMKSFIGANYAQVGTFSNHPFQLMANDGINQFVLLPTGEIGIGTATPATKLSVVTPGFGIEHSNGTTSIRTYIAGTFAQIGTYTNNPFQLMANNGSNQFVLMPTGEVGIATATPTATLEVNGSVTVDGAFKLNNGALANNTYLAGNASGDASWQPISGLSHITTPTNNYGFLHTAGIATIGTYVGTPSGGTVGGWIGTTTPHALYFFTGGGAPQIRLNTNGNVDIGTLVNSGAYRLNVAGNVNIATTSKPTTLSIDNNSPGIGPLRGIDCMVQNGQNNIGVLTQTIGSSSFNAAIYAVSSGATINWAGYFDGNVFTNGTYQTSDEKLKTNIAFYKDAVTALKQLPVKSYYFLQEGVYKKLNLSTELQVGIMAQDIEKVFPELVKTAVSQIMDENTHKPSGQTVEFKAVNYTGLVPVLVQGMQEQQRQIEELKAQVAELKASIKK